MAGAGAGLVPGHDAAPHVAILTDLEWQVLAGSWPVPRWWPSRCDPHRLGMAGAGWPQRRRDTDGQDVAILTDLEWPVLVTGGWVLLTCHLYVAILTDLEWPVLVA